VVDTPVRTAEPLVTMELKPVVIVTGAAGVTVALADIVIELPLTAVMVVKAGIPVPVMVCPTCGTVGLVEGVTVNPVMLFEPLVGWPE
jgi:hypothetical protein